MTTEFSSFAPPRAGDAQPLAPPSPGAPLTPASGPVLPPAGSPTIAPGVETSPERAELPSRAAGPTSVPTATPSLPSLPVVAAAPPASAPSTPGALASPDPTPPPAQPGTAAATGSPKRGRRLLVVVGLGLVASIGLGIGWLAWSAPDAPSLDPTPTGAPEPSSTKDVPIEPQDVSNPLVVPIDDARDVVADIDDNSGEIEALDMLGLDAEGNPAAAGYRFVWSYGVDATATVTVSATSGDYEFVSSDGSEHRRVDGTSYSRPNATAPWTVTGSDLLAASPRLGIDGPVTLDQILDPVTDGFASSVTAHRGDDTSATHAEIDDHAYWTEAPDARLAWLGRMGLPNPDQSVADGSATTVEIDVAADGRTVGSFTVTTPTASSSYALEAVFDTPPTIEVPVVDG